jgi:hypothetical protein
MASLNQAFQTRIDGLFDLAHCHAQDFARPEA